ncbi:MAG: hypothetical protein ACK4ZG_03635 [Bacteroidota bacterium]|jgi:hypothetical protein
MNNIFLVLFFFLPTIICAQVLNIDRERREDSLLKTWDLAVGLSLSSDKQKRNLLESNTNLEFVRNLPSRYFVAGLLRNDLEYNGPTQIQNEGLVHFRFRDRDTRKYSPELFIQSIWNGQWGLEYRQYVGASTRACLLEKKGLDLYAGLGLLHEWERWNWSGVRPELQPSVQSKIFVNRWRVNQYFKLSARAGEWVDLSAISYFQPGISSGNILPRWYVDANVYFKAGEKFSLVLHWDHILDLHLAVPIDQFFYGFSFGVQYGKWW